MNELAQLKEYIPKLKEDYQYTKLANEIADAIKHGKSSINVVMDFQISSEALDLLRDANISVEASTVTAGEYVFNF